MDLIDRQAGMAFPLSWDHRDKEHGSDEYIAGVECYRDYIEGLPSAQPDVARGIATILENEQDMRVMLASKPSAQPEIIRCKDCKYNDLEEQNSTTRWLPCIDAAWPDDWFCGCAERRKDE